MRYWMVGLAVLVLTSVVGAQEAATQPVGRATTLHAERTSQAPVTLNIPAPVAEAIKHAGNNQAQLVAALQKIPSDQREGLWFLIANMPPVDLQSLSADFLLDHVSGAYAVMKKVPWGKDIPKEIFLNNVLPYASVNERRDHWRKDFHTRVMPLIDGCRTPGAAAHEINKKFFPLVKVHYSKERKKADQSPYESIESGKASCTGLAILLVDACRAAGVPARFVGTPLWSDKSGNHSWVEVWNDGGWHFVGAAEPAGLDNAWFGHRAAAAQRDHPYHAIYAASFQRTGQIFPLVWAQQVDYVHAVNVTDRYTQRGITLPDGHARIHLQAVMGTRRVPAKVTVTDAEGKTVFTGTTNDERFDANDHLAAALPLNATYTVKAELVNRTLTQRVTFAAAGQLVTLNMADAAEKRSARFALSADQQALANTPEGKELSAALTTYFATAPDQRGKIAFTAAQDALLAKEPAAVKKLAFLAYANGWTPKQYAPEIKAHHVKHDEHVMPYVVRAVGSMPANGWPLFIALHGGGGAPKQINDSQWQVMMRYYRDHPEKGGYLYCAPRAPHDTWNSFYAGYNIDLTDRFIRQMILFADVDPDKVFIMGYSHGGYGAFFHGVIIPDHFAAIHASAGAPMGWDDAPKNLRNTVFTSMVGTQDKAHGRIDRCRWFDKYLKELRGDDPQTYRGGVTFIEHGHSGLPDRDMIAQMYPHVRNPVPRHVTWRVNNPLGYSYWLAAPGEKGRLVDAQCTGNTVTVDVGEGNKAMPLEVLLDERLIDYSKPVVIIANSARTVHTVKPSVKTLCETLAARGDPQYIFISKIPLEFKAFDKPKPTTQPAEVQKPAK